ncbi:hypothetical protein D3C86_1915820 [compost metagenome]
MKERCRTVGLLHSTSPISMDTLESAGRTFNTPGGNPARCASSAKARADNGVCSAGFTMTVQPAASAGATLRVIMATGKFHGVMAAQTPTGSCITISLRPDSNAGRSSPATRFASSAYHSTKDAP